MSIMKNLINNKPSSKSYYGYITKTDNGFRQRHHDSYVETIECNCDTGECIISFSDGRERLFNIGCSVFNSQFGIPYSKKHELLFVCNWEKGLYCYDINYGDLKWHLKSTRIMKALIYEDYLIVQKNYEALIKVDLPKGDIINSLQSKSIEKSFKLENGLIFIDYYERNYALFDPERFIIQKEYKKSIINPDKCLSIIIRIVELEGNKLLVNGFQQYANMDIKATESSVFNRVIDENIKSV